MSEKAKHLVLTGTLKTEVREHPIPEPEDNALLVKVEAACICGSDIHVASLNGLREPGVFGHEFCGRVVILGKKANESVHCFGGELKVGDRIAVFPWITCGNCDTCLRLGNGVCCVCPNGFCYGGPLGKRGESPLNPDPERFPYFKGGFGEYVYIFPGTYVWKVPEEMPSEIAALLDPTAVAMRAVEQTVTEMGILQEGTNLNTNAVVLGAGTIGILTAMILRSMGVENLVIADTKDEKLQLAKELTRADHAVNYGGMCSEERIATIYELTHGGADVVINCANHYSAQIDGMQMVRPLGTFVEVGGSVDLGGEGKEVPINLAKVIFQKNARITSVVANYPKTFDRAFRFLKRYQTIPFDKIITHRFHTLEEVLPTMMKMRDPDYLKGVYLPE